MHIPPARTIEIAETTVDVAVFNGAGILTFYGFTETTGGAGAEVNLRDGTGTDGALIVTVTLAGGESSRDLIPTPCLRIANALYLEVVSGSVSGSVWLVPGEHVDAYMLAQGVDPVWRGSE